MYESRTETPQAHAHFAQRLGLHIAVALGLLALSLAGGMGPVNPPLTPGGDCPVRTFCVTLAA